MITGHRSCIDGYLIPIFNRFSSFPRMRESSQSLERLDTRFRGNDEQGGFWPLKRTKPVEKRYK